MIIDKDQKFKNVKAHITDKITEQSIFNTFITMYPEDWKQLKITFTKFNRSKQFGKTIPLPKPEQSLRKEIRIWLKKNL